MYISFQNSFFEIVSKRLYQTLDSIERIQRSA